MAINRAFGQEADDDWEAMDDWNPTPPPTCCVCGVILDQSDDNKFTCNDMRCQRTWDDQVEEAHYRRLQRIAVEQEY